MVIFTNDNDSHFHLLNIFLRLVTMRAVKNTIRYGFASSQFINIFCTFAGAMYTFWESHQDEDPADINWKKHCVTITISLLAAAITFCTANYFQGKKIVEQKSEDSSIPDDIQDNPQHKANIDHRLKRSWTASTLEFGYVLLELATTICNNYFDYAAGKAWIFALTGSGYHKVFAKTHLYEAGAILLYSLLVDTPFQFSNGVYETSCEIHQIQMLQKKPNTGDSDTELHSQNSDEEIPTNPSYPAPLLTSLLKYTFANNAGRTWVKYIGTASHTLEHLIGLVLNIPATFLLLLTTQPYWLATFLSSMAVVFAIPVIFNVLQTYLFEGLISDKNLKDIAELNHSSEMRPLCEKEEKYKLIINNRTVFNLCKWGLYSQGPYHGLDTCMPVVLFMRHILLDGSLTLKLATIIPPTILIFIVSWAGSYLSEIKNSVEKIKCDETEKSLFRFC